MSYANPGPSSQDSQQWGFHRPNQGVKRAVDQGEEPGGGRRVRTKKNKTIAGAGIFNLSSVTLNANEKQILDKGLKFAPPRKLNKFETYMFTNLLEKLTLIGICFLILL